MSMLRSPSFIKEQNCAIEVTADKVKVTKTAFLKIYGVWI